MKIHRLTVPDAFASLKSGLAGLSEAEAQRRLGEYGANEVEEVAREALLLTFAKEFMHFFAIILWSEASLAFFAGHILPADCRLVDVFGVRVNNATVTGVIAN